MRKKMILREMESNEGSMVFQKTIIKKIIMVLLFLVFVIPVISYGGENPDTAMRINSLALLYSETERYAEAEPLYMKALEIIKKIRGEKHIDTAMIMNNLAELYRKTARYAEAELLYKRALEITKKVQGEVHYTTAYCMNNLAALYYETGRYVESEPLYKRALETREKVLGYENPDTVMSMNNLAVLYLETGRFVEAEPLFKRALEITKKVLKEEHPATARSMNNLAGLYHETGRYSEAEPLYKRALEITNKVLGEKHSETVVCINNLAELYSDTGRYTDAEIWSKRALEIRKMVLGKEHPHTVVSMNNLGALYFKTGQYAEAEPLYKMALEINKKVLKDKHPATVASMNNLALLYSVTGRYAEAEPLLMMAIEIRKKVLDEEHSDTALSMNNLALLYYKTGRYSEAGPLYERALDIRKMVLGEEHPDTALSMNNLAALYSTTEKYPESHKLFVKEALINDKVREMVFLLLSDKEKLNYMVQNQFRMSTFISNTLRHMKDNRVAVIDTFNAWLKWKGAVMEAHGRYIDALFYSDDPEIAKKYEELTNTRREMGRLQISGPGRMSLDAYKKRLEELERKKGALEAELSRLSKDFALEKMVGKADVVNISRILPEDSVYLDYAKIDLFNFTKKKFEESRYIAFVLIQGKVPVVKLIDLEETEEIDKRINSYMKEIKRVKEQQKLPRQHILKKRASLIYEAVLKPLEVYIKGKKNIYISPDGNLNLIPFEVLMTADGRYLMEDYFIHYISAGRDIMRFKDTSQTIREAVIIADPDYDMGLEEKETKIKELKLAGLELRGGMVSRDAVGLRFDRLPDTKGEADEIEKILEKQFKIKVQNYQDKEALEEVLFSVKSPMILHLSTHGYFLKDEEAKKFKETVFTRSGIDKIPDAGIENPMLRSGIVLAGVNESLKEGRDYGMVSSEKILGMRLRGTALVVLSACDTGVGDVQNGEGVFGLKRAFILSGAKTVVMSLWSVPSKETKELMVEFYTQMAKGKTKSEALRLAKINMMRKMENPFYWGAFIMVGNPE